MYILLDYEKKSSFVNVLLKKSFLSTKLGNCTEERFISEGVTWNLDLYISGTFGIIIDDHAEKICSTVFVQFCGWICF